MKRSCMVCKKEKGTKGLSFHRLPKNKEQLHLWLKNLGKENCIVSPNSVVCSEHFAPECLEPTFKRVNLRKGSIPALCSKQSHVSVACGSYAKGSDVHVQKKSSIIDMDTSPSTLIQPYGSYTKDSDVHAQKESSIIDMDAAPSTTIEELIEPHCSDTESSNVAATSSKCITPHQELRQRVLHDHQYTCTPRSYKRKFHEAQKHIHELRNSKRILGEKVKRLQATVTSLKDVVTELEEMNLVSQEALLTLNRRIISAHQ